MVLKNCSENAFASHRLGSIYHRNSDSTEDQDRAIGYLERAVAFGVYIGPWIEDFTDRSDKTNAQTWHLLGQSYVTRGFYFKAHEAFRHATYRKKDFVDCWLSLGALNVKMKQYTEAEVAYQKALELDHQRAESWIEMGHLVRDSRFV